MFKKIVKGFERGIHKPDDPRTRRRPSQTDANIQNIGHLNRQKRRLSIRDIAELIKIAKDSVRQIFIKPSTWRILDLLPGQYASQFRFICKCFLGKIHHPHVELFTVLTRRIPLVTFIYFKRSNMNKKPKPSEDGIG